MATRLITAAITTGLLTLTGCSFGYYQRSYQSFQRLDDRYPAISKGEQWEYSLEIKTPSGEFQRGTIQIRVDNEEEINQKTYVRTVTEISGIPDMGASYTYFRRSPEGIYKVFGRHINVPEFVETPFPLTVGKTWVVADPEGALIYNAESVETFKTPTRNFEHCLKVSFRRQDGSGLFDGYSYHSPEAGEVGALIKSGGTTIGYLLTDHKPGTKSQEEDVKQ